MSGRSRVWTQAAYRSSSSLEIRIFSPSTSISLLSTQFGRAEDRGQRQKMNGWGRWKERHHELKKCWTITCGRWRLVCIYEWCATAYAHQVFCKACWEEGEWVNPPSVSPRPPPPSLLQKSCSLHPSESRHRLWSSAGAGSRRDSCPERVNRMWYHKKDQDVVTSPLFAGGRFSSGIIIQKQQTLLILRPVKASLCMGDRWLMMEKSACRTGSCLCLSFHSLCTEVSFPEGMVAISFTTVWVCVDLVADYSQVLDVLTQKLKD